MTDKQFKLVSTYTYFIKEPNASSVDSNSWKSLVTWNGGDPPSRLNKQKSNLVFTIDEETNKIKTTCREVQLQDWSCFIRDKTVIHQSTKRYLQFTDNSKLKSPINYGFGFDSEDEARKCFDMIIGLQDQLKTKIKHQKMATVPMKTLGTKQEFLLSSSNSDSGIDFQNKRICELEKLVRELQQQMKVLINQ